MSYLYEKTIDPVLYDLNVFFEKGFYNAYTNYGEQFLADGVDLLKYFLEYNKSNVIVDPITSKVNIYVLWIRKVLRPTLKPSIKFGGMKTS